MTLQDGRSPATIAGLITLGLLLALGLLIVLRWHRHRLLDQGPDWQLMLDDMEYFKKSIWRILQARGYDVQWARVFNDAIDHQPHEVVFALRHDGELVAALCGRWRIPITSEIVTRFEAALATTQARRGLIITTSYFSEPAHIAAHGHPVELVDGELLGRWMEEIWN